ncbi:transcriptional regulator [Vulcanibacillus modesticaldus]|uniref:Transcriptional regulator n=1 Tax=Vulcanibacillus modesticaldus TaxID=337097 RepID=A0A1D2YTY7_9BACI|nr:substrate-binding domain-containing protein [Vulcanibacillus modesticaldus]OEF99164.1 transcriptional regulator [Vulcanibacillus modesticaldus]
MKKRITMQDVADKLGVTKVTVSKALSGKEGVSEELRKNIIATANEMGYIYNSSAKALKTNKTGNIGIIVPEVFMEEDEYFYTRIYKNIYKEVSEKNYNLILTIITKKEEEEVRLPLMCKENKVDGILIIGQISIEYIQKLKELSLPIVLVDFYYKELELDCILTDNYYATYNATNYLIESGHREIGFCGNIKLTSSIQDRYLGYYKALLEHQIPINENYIIKDRNDNGEFIDLQLPEKLPTAFICNCDKAAYELTKKLQSEGYRVPEDCSIIGFDDVRHSIISTPKLSTIRVKTEDIAKYAIKRIETRIQNPDAKVRRIVIDTEIINRESVKVLNNS